MKGAKVEKIVEKDELDQFIEKQNDKEWWMKIRDELNNKNVKLSSADLSLLQRIRSGKYADAEINPFDTYIEFDAKDFIHPSMSNEPKRRF